VEKGDNKNMKLREKRNALRRRRWGESGVGKLSRVCKGGVRLRGGKGAGHLDKVLGEKQKVIKPS